MAYSNKILYTSIQQIAVTIDIINEASCPKLEPGIIVTTQVDTMGSNKAVI